MLDRPVVTTVKMRRDISSAVQVLAPRLHCTAAPKMAQLLT